MNLRRKRMILMRDVWYGYLRTASGNPLTLQNAKRLRQLTIYGNAVQDGTPSPDAPVEVQLCGDRTGNLLDYDVFDNAPEYVSDLSSIGCFAISVPNGAYTMSTNIEIKNNLNAGAFLIANSLPDAITSPLYGVSLNNPRTVTVSNGTLYVCIYWRNTSIGASYPHIFTKEDFTSGTYWLMLVQGSYTADTLPAYEPYGYKVSGRAEGLNLFDISQVGDTNTLYNDGKKLKVTAYSNSTNLSVKKFLAMTGLRPGDVFTAARQYEVINGTANSATGSIRFNKKDGSGQFIIIPGNKDVAINVVPDDFNDDIYGAIAFYGANSGDLKEVIFSNIQILKGSYTAETMPPYEPYQPPQDFAVYLPEQIAKVGDVADEVVVDMESKTAELVRRIERNEFKGTDNWKNNWFPAIVKYLPGTAPGIPFSRCVSNYFDHNGDTSVPTTQIANVGGTTISVAMANLISGVTDAETFKTWLSDKNVYAYYPLAEPVTTDITSLQQWDAMPQVSGTVTLTLSAEVDPSGAKAVYYSKERGE